MLEEQAADDNDPSDQVCDPELAEQSESEQQPAHNHVREKCRLQRVFGPPSHNERVQPLRTVKFVILQRVDEIEAGEPQDHCRRQDQHLSDLPY